ncbi:MAG: hypothetical protein GY711_29410 [bacterium]|nr:hypothetical protein [bacterium]
MRPNGMPLIVLGGCVAALSLAWLLLVWFGTAMPHSAKYGWDELPRFCAGPVIAVVLTVIGWRVTRGREDASWTVWPGLVLFISALEMMLAAVIIHGH